MQGEGVYLKGGGFVGKNRKGLLFQGLWTLRKVCCWGFYCSLQRVATEVPDTAAVPQRETVPPQKMMATIINMLVYDMVVPLVLRGNDMLHNTFPRKLKGGGRQLTLF